MPEFVKVYDTTLRDGLQDPALGGVSVDARVAIVRALDRQGVHYIEAGCPIDNRPVLELCGRLRRMDLKARLVAFGFTCHPGRNPSQDAGFRDLLRAGTPVVAIVGKSHLAHVVNELKTDQAAYLGIVRRSIMYFKSRDKELIFYAEHFFDAARAEPLFALQVIQTAVSAGADMIVLCDTNGGARPEEIRSSTKEVLPFLRQGRRRAVLGIHVHDDGGMAVYNTIAGVQAGANVISGTWGDFGERCANANLPVTIAGLELKYQRPCLPPGYLELLVRTTQAVYRAMGRQVPAKMPYIGPLAFTHKAGVHISAVAKGPGSYEHISPESVGNRRSYVVSGQAGKAAIRKKAAEFGLKLEPEQVARVLREIKEKEAAGWRYDNADASLLLLMLKASGQFINPFNTDQWKSASIKKPGQPAAAESSATVTVGDVEVKVRSEGVGQVNTLYQALRKAVVKHWPAFDSVRLTRYQVEALYGEGVGALVRVELEFQNGSFTLNTTGVSHDVVEASYMAIIDALHAYYYLSEKTKIV